MQARLKGAEQKSVALEVLPGPMRPATLVCVLGCEGAVDGEGVSSPDWIRTRIAHVQSGDQVGGIIFAEHIDHFVKRQGRHPSPAFQVGLQRAVARDADRDAFGLLAARRRVVRALYPAKECAVQRDLAGLGERITEESDACYAGRLDGVVVAVQVSPAVYSTPHLFAAAAAVDQRGVGVEALAGNVVVPERVIGDPRQM